MLTNKQIAERRSGIGGSDVAAILGLSPWRTPLDVYLDKTGQGVEVEETGPMRWGSLLEPVILDEFERQTGFPVHRGLPLMKHDTHKFLIGNLDGITDGGIVEAKTARSDKDWGEPGSAEIPVYYQAQVAHYMAVTGAVLVYVPVLIGASDFRIYQVERDEAFIADLIEAERAFWHDHVLAGIPPEPVNAADALRLWARDNGTTVEADAVVVAQIATLKKLKAEAKDLDARIAEVDGAVRIAFGESAAIAAAGQVLATYKTQSARRIDTKALEAAHPDIADKFRTESTSRVLRLK